ncbi:MAG: cardiolipin synthase ClsB [Sinimarinibacterium flocculans]|uniref:cardiolipin synthase ClsB n=1 Tax=Sinimarinibacterium flocculans TaxID=985250 RepID=UPI003C358A58
MRSLPVDSERLTTAARGQGVARERPPAGRLRWRNRPQPPRPAVGAWTLARHVRLLENGEDFFPAVFAAIAKARSEVLIETFILFDDDVGRELQSVLIAAASRGVRVAITTDGYGSPDLPDDFVAALTGAGVDFRYFDPRPRLFGYRTNALRRLHRKLVIVDRHHAFVGGINFSLEHLARYGAKAKQDYAVEVQGPIVEHVRALALALLENRRLPRSRPWWRSRAGDPPAGDDGDGIATKLIWRDNDHHRDDIEIHYRWAIRKARHEIVIANAYFFPGYRLMRDLRRAARRGVRVLLILQGRSDQPVASWAARSLYAQLMRAGVQIYEYCRRPLHGKVAVVDGRWSTVGSSNLDPSSLSLNLEANLVFDDHELASDLRRRLQVLVDEHCERIDPGQPPPQPLWRRLAAYLAFHIIRRVPTWDRWLPQREQGAVPAQPPEPTPEPVTAEQPPGAADVQSDEPSPPSKCAS